MCLCTLWAQMNVTAQVKGPSSSQTPYVIPVATGVKTTSILTVQDKASGYSMVGIPDGLGAFDNGDGTFTLLMNHELGSGDGIVRAHGGKGAFVSSWIVRKSDLSVVSGGDLITSAYGWNAATQSSNTAPSIFNFNRFCSGDLPKPTAFYNTATGLGSTARIYMHGEEGGATGYQMATVASGANKGKSYVLGRFNLSTNGSGLSGTGGWENALANPYAQDKTVVIGNNDGGTGIMSNALAVYVGMKTNTGSEVDKAGLTNGTLKFVNVAGNPAEIVNTTTRATNITSGTHFTLSGSSSTTFSRPEDGAWDPVHPNQYYFVTTDRLDQVSDGIGTQVGRSRLWRLTFTDITNPDLGGTIDLLLDGTEGQNMLDNLAVDHWGHLLLQEDVGNAAHNGKIWQYTIATDQLKLIAKHDAARFGDIGLAATAPFNQDEESSGIIDVQEILGAGMFLLVDQAHYPRGGEFAEGGQLMALYNPDTYNTCSSYTGKITVNPSPTVAGQKANTIYLGYGTQSVSLTAAPDAQTFPPYSYSWSNGGSSNSIMVSPDATTEYTVTIRNAFGCAIQVKQTIDVIDIRDGEKNKVFICHNGHVQSVSVNAVPAHLAHGDQLGSCELESSRNAKLPTRTEQGVSLEQTVIYPNPVHNAAKISIALEKDATVNVRVMSMDGKVVIAPVQKKLSAGRQVIDINTSSLRQGNYFVEVSTGNQVTRKKIIVIK